jgi:AAA domain/RepB DNA-primase N-terminal domain
MNEHPTNLLDLPVPDFEEAQSFLGQLDPDIEDFTFQTFTESDEKKKTYTISPISKKLIDPLAKVLHGSLQQHWQALCSLSRQGAGVYVTINRTALQGPRSKENIIAVRAYVADLDRAPLENHKRLKVEPHFIVQTSPGRFQVGYGISDAPLDAARFKQTQQRLAQLMGGDPSICDLPRVIRVAGFPHQKDGSARKLVRLISGSEDPNYSEDYFQNELATALAEQARAAPARRSLVEAAMAGLSDLPDRSKGIREGECWGHGAKGVGRDNAMMAWAGHLFRKGLTEQEVLEDCLAWDATFEPPLGETVVRDKVSRLARKEAANVSGKATPISPIELKPLDDSEFANLRWHGEGEQLVTPQWLIKNLLPETGVALLSGQWGTGKTFIALDAAVSVMIGAQFATYRCKRPGGVLYIAAEGGSQIPIRLTEILREKHPLHKGPLPFAWLDYCPPFTPGAGEVGMLQFAEEAARRMWEKHGVPLVLIIIDTLAAAARFKDENAAAEVQQAMDVLNTISRATGSLVMAVDHFGKAADTGTRGSSAKEASADAVIACLAERTNSGTISNTRIAVRKLRAGATGAETTFTLSVLPMGVDEDGDPMSTCVVAWSPVTVAAPLDRTSLFQNDKPLISLSFVEGEGSLTGYDPG